MVFHLFVLLSFFLSSSHGHTEFIYTVKEEVQLICSTNKWQISTESDNRIDVNCTLKCFHNESHVINLNNIQKSCTKRDSDKVGEKCPLIARSGFFRCVSALDSGLLFPFKPSPSTVTSYVVAHANEEMTTKSEERSSVELTEGEDVLLNCSFNFTAGYDHQEFTVYWIKTIERSSSCVYSYDLGTKLLIKRNVQYIFKPNTEISVQLNLVCIKLGTSLNRCVTSLAGRLPCTASSCDDLGLHQRSEVFYYAALSHNPKAEYLLQEPRYPSPPRRQFNSIFSILTINHFSCLFAQNKKSVRMLLYLLVLLSFNLSSSHGHTEFIYTANEEVQINCNTSKWHISEMSESRFDTNCKMLCGQICGRTYSNLNYIKQSCRKTDSDEVGENCPLIARSGFFECVSVLDSGFLFPFKPSPSTVTSYVVAHANEEMTTESEERSSVKLTEGEDVLLNCSFNFTAGYDHHEFTVYWIKTIERSSSCVYSYDLDMNVVKISGDGTANWSTPPEILHSYRERDLWIAPPQFYDIGRMLNFSSLSDLHDFARRRSTEGCERCLPVIIRTSDCHISLLPGDSLYPEEPDRSVSTEKSLEEVQDSHDLHRIVMRDPYESSVYINITPKYKHLPPLTTSESKQDSKL
ncbi:nucleoside diphosphate-linked moiety X motif 19 [Silurus asotus]|uniref:Nucleoside diphosphate-linked moiety X motif 19 n=1 Tax=Silurus asotus TaxID=30991 RepID=A0AAD5AP72_SILAS|nr:nucleoside diphosphate-linked moiety X motif 19 [Silurus asotus]